METEVRDAIDAHGGYLLRRHLLELGLTDKWIARAVKAGLLKRIRHGTYVDATTHAAADTRERHLVTLRSAIERMGGDVVASHQSAAVALGLDLYGVDLATIHLTRADGNVGRREAGIIHHEGRLDPQDIVEVNGIRVVRAQRTVFDLATHATTESAMVTASSALRMRMTTHDGLALEADRHVHRRGNQRARLAIGLSDGLLASVGEVRSVYAMWRQGIPRPRLQAVISDENGVFVARVDFLWDLFRHIGEFDGSMKYGGIADGPDARTALIEEKIREDRARACWYGVSRWMWPDLSPSRVAGWARQLGQDLEQSRRLYTRNATHIALS